MRRTITAAALLLSIVPGLAQAADLPCLTAPEADAVSRYALPSVISGAGQRCTALPADSYLRKQGPALAGRFGPVRAKAWPQARIALQKVAATMNPQAADLFRTMPEPALQQIADQLVVSMVAEKLPADRCSGIDRTLSLLSPLPVESTAELISLAIGFMAQGEKPRIGKLSICKA